MGNSGSEPDRDLFLSVVRIDEMLEESGIKKNVRLYLCKGKNPSGGNKGRQRKAARSDNRQRNSFTNI